jgi:spoIIIJ-associated protein
VDQVERSAASVEEALDAALAELGISEQEARVEILQEPRGGFLGLGGQGAIVRVTRIAGSGLTEPAGEDEDAELAADFLEGLLEAMGVDADLEINPEDGVTYLDLWSPDAAQGMGLLIGRHGQTLDALQELVRTHTFRRTGRRSRVVVDVEDYRKRRKSQLVRAASSAGRRVIKSGKPQSLEPMTAFERKIVHDAVAELGGLETESEGEEPNRHVVIRRKT